MSLRNPKNRVVLKLKTTSLIEEYPSYHFVVDDCSDYSSVKFFFAGEVEAFHECFRERYLVADVVLAVLRVLPYEDPDLERLTHVPPPFMNSVLRLINTGVLDFNIEEFISFETDFYMVIKNE